jgi:uncharacterized protein YjiS (DUF1127 family)
MHSHISLGNPVFSSAPETSARGGGLRHFLSAVMRRWQRRKMIATFDAMDDHILRDIGLRREDIVRVVDSFDEMRRPVAALPVSGGIISGIEANIQRPLAASTPPATAGIDAAGDTRKAA